MKGLNGKVKTVISIDLLYQGPTQRLAGSAAAPCLYTVYRAVWTDESTLTYKREPDEQEFRDAEG
jgi:hypothetical protein